MATFSHTSDAFVITFVNHSNTELNYDLRTISGDQTNYGNISPGDSVQSGWDDTDPLEYGQIAVVGIGQFGQSQLVPAPGVRFWSGYGSLPHKDQYINLLAGNGWRVTRNTSELSEVTGNGFRVTVDGGGQPNPDTINIVFQVYNA